MRMSLAGSHKCMATEVDKRPGRTTVSFIDLANSTFNSSDGGHVSRGRRRYVDLTLDLTDSSIKMKNKDPGVATSCGKGASGSRSSSSKSRSRPQREKAKYSTSKVAQKLNPLTVSRVAHIISQLDNKRGSTMESIRSKLVRSGQMTRTSLVRNALERAVKAGLLRENKEERFSLPRDRTAASGSSSKSSSKTTSSGSRTRKSITHVAPVGKRRLRLSASAARSDSNPDTRRRRRPPQGRRPANADNGGNAEGGEPRDRDDDTGAGDDDQVGDIGDKDDASNRLSVEPVAGCDAVMVFGTH